MTKAIGPAGTGRHMAWLKKLPCSVITVRADETAERIVAQVMASLAADIANWHSSRSRVRGRRVSIPL